MRETETKEHGWEIIPGRRNNKFAAKAKVEKVHVLVKEQKKGQDGQKSSEEG